MSTRKERQPIKAENIRSQLLNCNIITFSVNEGLFCKLLGIR